MVWFVVLFLLFFLRGSITLDPDFGWHLKMGEYILSFGIPQTDPFSYTMPSYHFIDHEWLTNVFFFLTPYPVLATIFALLGVGALFFSLASLKKEERRYQGLPLVLVGFILIGIVGVRPQVISWFLFAGLLWIVRSALHFQKWLWLLPLLIVLWVNLHGSFPLALGTIALSSGYWWKKGKVSLRNVLLLLGLCFVATAVNPYGFRIWWEVWMQMSDGSLRWIIQEWTPAIVAPHVPFWLFAAFSSLLIWRYRKRFSFLDLLLYSLLFVATASSIRHMALWFMIALPMTVGTFYYFAQEVRKLPGGAYRLRKAYQVLGVMVGVFVLATVWSLVSNLGVKQSGYPEQAVAYLNNHPSKGQVFSSYDWGGYLIWKLPDKKVFIDGRMPSWRWQANLPQESNYALHDYQDFLTGKTSFNAVTSKYAIQTLLLPQERDMPVDPLTNMIIVVGRDILQLPVKQEKTFTLLKKQAEKNGWKRVYQDEEVVIYQKPL